MNTPRRRLLLLLTATLLGSASQPATAERLPRLVLSGPAASVSVPLIHMVETGALNDVADSIEFQPWKDPDQLRVMVLGKKADFVAMPTNVAANLHARGADMPDIVFSLLAEKQGLDPRKDFALRYVASPLDAMQLLVTRRVDHALLAEPAVSMALRKTRSFPVSLVAPELHRSVDLQQEWGRLLKREARMPQAGVAAVGRAATDDALQKRIATAYAASLAWCNRNALKCGEMVARRIDLLSPEAVADGITAGQMRAVSAAAARPELEFFLGQLHARNPALVGGKLPDDSFYGGGQ